MGVKKQMDTFFASLGEQTGYNGRLVNTPMGPFRWNDVIQLWENVNNGMVMNNISFMDEFAMMDYGTVGGDGSLVTPVYLNLDFTTGVFDSRISFFENGVGPIVNSQGVLDYAENNLLSWSDYGWTGWGQPSGSTRTEIPDVDGNAQRGARITIPQPSGGNASLSFGSNYKTTSKSLIFWIRGSTLNIGNCGGAAENVIEIGMQTPTAATNGGFDGPAGTSYGATIWGFSDRGTCELIGGFTSGVVVDKRDPFRANLWRINNLSTTQWTKVKVTNYDSAGGVNIYPGTAGLGNGATFTFDFCQMQLQAGIYDKGYRRTTGSPYYGPRITSGSTGGATLGWWLEPELKNLLRNSMNLASSGLSGTTGWTLSRCGITWTTEVLCPAGFSDGYKLFDDTTAGTPTHRIISDAVTQVPSVYSASAGFSFYTASTWFKAGGLTNAYIAITDPSETAVARANFDLVNYAVGSTLNQNGITLINAATGLELYNNGWARAYLTAQVGTGSSLRVQYGTAIRANENAYLGTGTGFVYMWGPQFETTHLPSSYMPTGNCGANSFILRSSNTAIMGNTGNFFLANPNEGTIDIQFYHRNTQFLNFPQIISFRESAPSCDPQTYSISISASASSYYTGINLRTAGGTGTNAFTYYNQANASLSPPRYNNFIRLSGSFLGLSGSSSYNSVSVNGITSGNSIVLGNGGGTLNIPVLLDFQQRCGSNPDGHPGVVIRRMSFEPIFRPQSVLVQRTT